jgi:hypothetical protein
MTPLPDFSQQLKQLQDLIGYGMGPSFDPIER